MANEVNIIVKMTEDITDATKSMTSASRSLNKEFEALPGAAKGHKNALLSRRAKEMLTEDKDDKANYKKHNVKTD